MPLQKQMWGEVSHPFQAAPGMLSGCVELQRPAYSCKGWVPLPAPGMTVETPASILDKYCLFIQYLMRLCIFYAKQVNALASNGHKVNQQLI